MERRVEWFVIMHKGEVFKGLLFKSSTEARNAIRFANPKSSFKENIPNILVCAKQGSKFQVIKLTEYPSVHDF